MSKKYEKPVIIPMAGKEDLLCIGFVCSPGSVANNTGSCRTGNNASRSCLPGSSASRGCLVGSHARFLCVTGNQRIRTADTGSVPNSVISCNDGMQLDGYLYIEE
ncbi:MAG: hypothetical protein ABRQ39_31130 [Candidatus Eremiobacterota bacterium]